MFMKGEVAAMEPFGGEHTRKVRVAWLYYIEGLTQDAIAAQLGVTRMRVQRLLAQARDEGLVRITITDPSAETIALAAELKRLFGLSDALVTPAPTDPAYVRRFIGYAAAEYLADCLHDDMSLGVGWGMTLEETARALPARLLDRFSVVSLMGGLTRSSALNPHEIAWQLARTLRGECCYLAAPTYADSLAARDAILGESAIRDVLRRGRMVDAALVSVGAFGPDSTPRHGPSRSAHAGDSVRRACWTLRASAEPIQPRRVVAQDGRAGRLGLGHAEIALCHDLAEYLTQDTAAVQSAHPV